jgi:histidyl-tRNA synthetase
MNARYHRLKGTRDIFLEEIERWRWCEEVWAGVLGRFGYGEIRTPIIEPTALFLRSVGAGTDIVDKEMYTFETRDGGESLTLRPEMTASVVRAYLENGLQRQPGTLKFFYMGPMFRHDRPQAGRYRQFHQLGVEAIGSASPVLDAEVIHLAMELFDAVDATGLTVRVNSIGCRECRPPYLADLTAFLRTHLDEIPAPFHGRIDTNPLRLYDAKDDAVQAVLGGFRPITDSLCAACREHHAVVIDTLGRLGVPVQADPTLVRGLDYYTRTTFEITAGGDRKQSSVAGGGRYDHLVEQCGGPAVPAVGFSIGIERTLLHLGDEPVDPQLSRPTAVDVFVACLGRPAEQRGLELAGLLRGFCRVEVDTTGRALKTQLKSAVSRRARLLLTIGTEELEQDTVRLKDLGTGDQTAVARAGLLDAVREVLEG